MANCTLTYPGGTLSITNRTAIMGIVNVTPDSFSDGGRYNTVDQALAHAEQLIEDGADILDIGGESTRPFAPPVSQEEELRRVIPVIEAITRRFSIPVSIDTTKSAVATSALDAGAVIVNDISAGTFDPDLLFLCAQKKVPVILMHMQGCPETMQKDPRYRNVVAEILSYLKGRIKAAMAAGIPSSQIIVDPGIGFGKTMEDNLTILAALDRFSELKVPLLLGTSRKTFIRTLVATTGDPLPPDSMPVEYGTLATSVLASFCDTAIIRVHDVAATHHALQVADAISNIRKRL